jgi:hypothetical protein
VCRAGKACFAQEDEMELLYSTNTCSQAELCRINAETVKQFESELQELISQAKAGSRESIVANMHEHIHAQFGASLKRAGFVFVGTYPGNSDPTVYMWVYGLTPASRPKTAKIKTAVRKIKRAIAR